MTIQATPALYSSTQEDLIYTIYDPHVTNPVTYPNYKYVGDIYIGAIMVARIKKVPDPVTGIGIFNIGQIIRSYITTSFDPIASVLVAQQLGLGIFNIGVTLKFGEEYAYTIYPDIIVDSSRKYFNNYNGRLLGSTSSLIGKIDKIASDSPKKGQVYLSNNYYFIPYFPTSTDPVSVIITPNIGSGFTTSFTASNAYDLQSLNISPGALNAIHPGAITDATTSYTVQIGSEVNTIEVTCDPIYQNFTLHFLNKYGGFETKLFSKVSRKTIDFAKKDFGKLPYTVSASGVVSYKSANGVYNESRSVYSSQFKEKFALNSDFMTDGEYTWLEQLVASPMLYIEDSGYFYPCKISENNYEPKKYINDDLTNLAITIEYGETYNAQYR